MSKRNYYTTPYSSFELGIHREFSIPVPVKMELTRDDLELYVGSDGQLRHFAVAGAVAAAAPLLEKLPLVGKIADAAKNIASKIGLGGSDQDRFILRTQDVFAMFKSAGYNDKFAITYTDYKLGKSQVDNNKPQSYWYDAFQRLRNYIIDRLNGYNPGLGDAYAELFPEFKMANEGQMIGEPITALKEILKAFPPGTYKGASIATTVNRAYQSATGNNGVQSLLASASAGRPFEDGADDDTKQAETKQVVTYVTVGLAVVLLIIAVIVHLKKKSA